jgi:hypothetical protein
LPMINLKIAVSGVQMLSQGIQSQCKYAIKELLRADVRQKECIEMKTKLEGVQQQCTSTSEV